MSFPNLNELIPSSKDLTLIHQLEEKVAESGYNLLKKINELYNDGAGPTLQIVTSESLTAGLIMSSLVNIPIAGWAKYGCFGVYDTDAKRVFNSVKVDDVYTHTCAKEMAIGLLKNSNATLAISVTGNAMPYFSDLEKLGEVFIGVAGYNAENKVIYETRSVNNCTNPSLGKMLMKEIQQKCFSWYNSQPDKHTYAKRSDTAAISRLIRNYTAILAMKFTIEFLEKNKLVVPQFIINAKNENKKMSGNDCKHNNIPIAKYPRNNIEETCVSLDNCNNIKNNYCERWGTKEIKVSKSTPPPRTASLVYQIPQALRPQALLSSTIGGKKRRYKKKKNKKTRRKKKK